MFSVTRNCWIRLARMPFVVHLDAPRGGVTLSYERFTMWSIKWTPEPRLKHKALIPSAPTRRPADLLTIAASSGRAAALDVVVASPDAGHAGADCAQTMYEKKLNHDAPYRAQLERQNLEYKPLVFSCFGRPHPETHKYLVRVTKQLARRRSFAAASTLLR